jgi:hypothetical protein
MSRLLTPFVPTEILPNRKGPHWRDLSVGQNLFGMKFGSGTHRIASKVRPGSTSACRQRCVLLLRVPLATTAKLGSPLRASTPSESAGNSANMLRMPRAGRGANSMRAYFLAAVVGNGA